MKTPLDKKNMDAFWCEHSKIWKDLDRSTDKDGLANVLYTGAPLWFNKFFDYFQKKTFKRLLSSVSGKELKVLDVGCGCGRWTSILSQMSNYVVAIDLQKETLMKNKHLIPNCLFLNMDTTKLGFKSCTFDLISSITVIQHIPYNEQIFALDEIQRVVKKEGYLLMIENIRHIDSHVFGRGYKEWKSLLEDRGFELISLYGCGYAPLFQILNDLIRFCRNIFGKVIDHENVNGKELASLISSRKGFWPRIYYLAHFPVIVLSYIFEPFASCILPDKFALHGAYLFRKR